MHDTHLHEEFTEQHEQEEVMKIDVPIRCYYHVSFLNDYLRITQSIFDKMIDSGLMDACEGVFIGCLGSEDELHKFKELISKYPKAKIIDWSNQLNLWEGFTLQYLKHDADALPEFYACYLHSKGCTRSYDDTDTYRNNEKRYEEFWKDYLVYSVVTRWKDCYKALSLPDIGYDTASCRMIPLRKSASIVQHGSGNMWWAQSEYIKTLIPFSDTDELPNAASRVVELYKELHELHKTHTLHIRDEVFFPEMWLWLGQPLTYIVCNPFTQGMPYHKTFEETMKDYPIKKYSTDISKTL